MNKLIKKELDEIMQKYDWKTIEDIDWSIVSHDHPFSEDFVRKFKDQLNWRDSINYQPLSQDFIEQFYKD